MSARISLAMIVKDEETRLPACLRAARPWVDEIVVVDTGSTDRTQELAREFGAVVHEWAWRDDFAAARNEALGHATGEWILSLDADETLTAESGPALREACNTAPPDVVGFNVKVICPYADDGGLTQLNWFPRLFRKLPGVRWEGVIHEQVVPSLLVRGRIERSGVAVLHAGYVLPAAELEAKARRNVVLLERQVRDEPDFAPSWLQLAETYVCLGQVNDACDAYRRCLSLLAVSRLTLTSSLVSVALQNFGMLLLTHRDETEGLRLLREALVVNPELVSAHIHLGSHALRTQRWADAERHLAAALAIAERQTETAEYRICPWLIYRFYSQALFHQDRLDEAIAALERSLALAPGNTETLQLLAMIGAKAGRWTRALAVLDDLAAAGADGKWLHAQRGLAFTALGRFDAAADAWRAALVHDPSSVDLGRELADALSRAGRPAEAAAVYEQLSALAPDAPAPWIALGKCREALGDRAGMLAAYRRAVELAPESGDVLFALGSACLRTGLLEAADECLTDATAHQPDRPDIRIARIACLIQKGARGEAAAELDAVLTRWPNLDSARTLRALVDSRPAASVAGAAEGAARS